MIRRGTKRPRFSVGGHPVYENDDSSNHSGLGVMDFDDNSLSQHHEASNNSSDQQHFPQNQYVPDRSRRVQQRPSVKPSNEETNYLNACLDHFHTTLSRKDKEGFFQYPVTDQLAPGYSQIITQPMDFSTMKKKINNDEYSNLVEFRTDFELMCDNAMKYNRTDTVYWQAAKRLAAVGAKLMSKEKMLSLRRMVDCFSHLTEREFGFPLENSNHINNEEVTVNNHEPMETMNNDQEHTNNSVLTEPLSSHPPAKPTLRLPRYYEKLPTLIADEEDDEEFSPEEILSQAQHAAQCPREKLSLRRPISTYRLTCQRNNGTTSLRFLNQDELNQHTQTQTRTITIGELSSLPSSAGAPQASAYHPQPTPIVNETEKRNHLLPRYFLDYGQFSSHAPQYDSSFSSITKRDLDLLIHTYGSEFSTQNPISTIDYLKDSGDLALAFVDKFLMKSKNGENGHEKEKTSNGTKINGFGDDHTENHSSSNGHENLQQHFDMKLDETARLLVQLRQAQYDRLCQPTNKVHQISNSQQQQQQNNEPLNESDLAEKVLTNLSDMTHLTSNGPSQVISADAIHHSLGITLEPESCVQPISETS